MSVIDEVLAANEIYSRTHQLRRLTPRPERKLAVLTCMDTRLTIRSLGLRTADGVGEEALPDAPELDGLVRRRGGRAVLTQRGRLLANAVTMYLR